MPAAVVTVSVPADLCVDPGATVDVPVSLENAGAVRGLSFALQDTPDELQLASGPEAAACTPRTPGFTCTANEVAAANVINGVVLSFAGDAIAPGTGPVVTLRLTDGGIACTPAQPIALTIANVLASDVDNHALPTEVLPGSVRCGCATTTSTTTSTTTTSTSTTTTSSTTSTTTSTTIGPTTTTTTTTTTATATTTSTTTTTTTTVTTTSTSTTTSTTTTSTTTTTVANGAPDCSGAAASPVELFPPDHKFVAVSVTGITDSGDPISITFTRVEQDEPPATGGCPDAMGVGTGALALRAERNGQGDGRVYHVHFTATDGRGGACSGAVTVCAPHDQRPGQACDDGGALFDSTGPGATSDRDGIVPLVAGGKGDAAPPGCVIGLALGSPATCSAGRPATLARRLTTVQALLARSETARNARHVKRLVKRLDRAIRNASRVAARADERGAISTPCSRALADALATAHASAARWLAAP